MRSECCLAKASTSGVTVRVCSVVKRMRSLPPASDSTIVLPQVPSPTTAALIMPAPSRCLFGPGQHREDDAGEHPEHAIFDAADHPDPLLGDLVGGSARDEQMESGDGGDIGRVEVEHEPDCQKRLDGAGDVH